MPHRAIPHHDLERGSDGDAIFALRGFTFTNDLVSNSQPLASAPSSLAWSLAYAAAGRAEGRVAAAIVGVLLVVMSKP